MSLLLSFLLFSAIMFAAYRAIEKSKFGCAIGVVRFLVLSAILYHIDHKAWDAECRAQKGVPIEVGLCIRADTIPLRWPLPERKP